MRLRSLLPSPHSIRRETAPVAPQLGHRMHGYTTGDPFYFYNQLLDIFNMYLDEVNAHQWSSPAATPSPFLANLTNPNPPSR